MRMGFDGYFGDFSVGVFSAAVFGAFLVRRMAAVGGGAPAFFSLIDKRLSFLAAVVLRMTPLAAALATTGSAAAKAFLAALRSLPLKATSTRFTALRIAVSRGRRMAVLRAVTLTLFFAERMLGIAT